MNRIELTVYGEPVGKGRPRHTKDGRVYTPQKTADYEKLVRLEYNSRYKGMQFEADEPLCMQIIAYVGIPKSTSKRKQELMRQGLIKPTKKPDWDNIAKIIGDALNNTAYPDDKQIAEAHIEKYFSLQPRVEIAVWRCSNE